MLVYTPKKAVIFKTKEPAKFTTVIPTAKAFKWKGDDVVAVPHRPD